MTNSFIIKRTISYQDINMVKKQTIHKSLSHDSNLNKYNDDVRLNSRKYIILLYLIFIEYSTIISYFSRFLII